MACGRSVPRAVGKDRSGRAGTTRPREQGDPEAEGELEYLNGPAY